MLKGYSSILSISLCWIEERNWLRFYDPATGSYLNTLPEMYVDAERAWTERAAREADQARIPTEDELSRLRQRQ